MFRALRRAQTYETGIKVLCLCPVGGASRLTSLLPRKQVLNIVEGYEALSKIPIARRLTFLAAETPRLESFERKEGNEMR